MGLLDYVLGGIILLMIEIFIVWLWDKRKALKQEDEMLSYYGAAR